MPIGAVWQTFLETPLINTMVALSSIFFGSYGLAILIFTVIIRALLFPLTLRMLHSMKALQAIQPQMQEIQKKYSDPKRRNQEVMKLYREAGVNPLGCLGPQLVQFPIFIALYQVIRITLGNTPESVLGLSGRLYNVDFIQEAVPLSRTFLGMDLGSQGSVLLMVLVFAAMWLQQRISTNRATLATQSEQQRQMNQMMQWMMPALFSWFVIITPAGLGLYWATSTIIGIVLQWMFVGPGDFKWGSLIPNLVRSRVGMPMYVQPPPPRPATKQQPGATPKGGESESRNSDEVRGDDGKNGRGGNITRPQPSRPAPRSGRRRRHHRG
ncbi:MAG: membrane protein insertase YidC [Chloroflexi bacterium]|nr:YidC/Oxa1 family membrane protein insertase [Chloroflexota bacterium]MDA1241107.1 YidC/Oxa1 family membrane protein insertase [Chloroflexota bacterium]MQC18983.1 membrane protein insertase YidC [Chloroflexota bacterium]